MKFEISRTSMWNDEQPCEEAYSQMTEFWTHEGEPNPIKVWFVDLNSLEELMEFLKKYGNLVLMPLTWRADTPALEIYDDHRE